ncbi:DUF1127 domain-containing protein [Salinicola avicenniae]|uniref:DUF1127 domain-containing protein n=1 Tax=Salinicola avicenniae TaxID=2916836 RepID=UPI00207363B5|nr:MULTISPECIES: DUF1127 domain-containing protein [unclassified Salinicola]
MRFTPLSLIVSTLDMLDGIVWGGDAHAQRPLRRFAPRAGQRWRTRRQLSTLDERQLKDIGLLPSQAYRESHRPFWR